jgi:hypothetical protein
MTELLMPAAEPTGEAPEEAQPSRRRRPRKRAA